MKRAVPALSLLLLLLLAFPQARAQGPAFEERSFPGAGGTEIRYLFRPGQGPAVVVLHGTIMAAEALKQGAQEFFPGRPVLALYRRGYAPSGMTKSTPESLAAENEADIAKAIEQARGLSGGEKVCLVAFSLGAMMLPPIDPERVLWVALINPAGSGMLEALTPEKQAMAWGLKNAYEASRYWHPVYRDAWIDAASRALADEIVDLIHAQEPRDAGPFSAFLIGRIEERLRGRAWRELIVQERVWALFPERRINLPRKVPVFMAGSAEDGMIPPGVHERLVERVKASAAWVEDVRWPGGHLTPVFKPDLLLGELDRFDHKVRSR